MANNFTANPIFLDTDTTVGAGTNWRGASGGSKYVGGIGIRPMAIVLTPAATAFTGGVVIKINEVTSTGSTGVVLWQSVPLAATPPTEFIFNAPPGWHDWIITGLTSGAAVAEIYYRV